MSIIKKAEVSGHPGAVYALEIGNFSHTVFSAGADKIVAEWNLDTFAPEKFSVKTDAPVYSLCHITEKGLLFIGLSNGSLHVVDLKEKKETRHIRHHSSAVYDIKYLPAKNLLFTCDGSGNFCVWEAADLKLLLTLPLCNEKIRQMDIHPSGNEIAVACGDGAIRVFDTSYFNEKHRLSGHSMSVNSVKYICKGKYLLTGGKDAHLNSYDAENDYMLLKSIPAHNFAIYSIAENETKQVFFTASRDKTIKMWDSHSFQLITRIDKKQYNGHGHSVNKVYFSGYKNLLVSAGDDRNLFFWSTSAEDSVDKVMKEKP